MRKLSLPRVLNLLQKKAHKFYCRRCKEASGRHSGPKWNLTILCIGTNQTDKSVCNLFEFIRLLPSAGCYLRRMISPSSTQWKSWVDVNNYKWCYSQVAPLAFWEKETEKNEVFHGKYKHQPSIKSFLMGLAKWCKQYDKGAERNGWENDSLPFNAVLLNEKWRRYLKEEIPGSKPVSTTTIFLDCITHMILLTPVCFVLGFLR